MVSVSRWALKGEDDEGGATATCSGIRGEEGGQSYCGVGGEEGG